MNPRIKELANEARNYALDEKRIYERIHNTEQCMEEYREVYNKKFAELIVKDITTGQRELAKIMSDTGSEDQAYILRITASNIERKYGVER